MPLITNNLNYFQDTYADCRKSFRELSEKLSSQYPETQLGSLMIESKEDSDLTVDWFYIPARKNTNKLVMMTSGLHGIEGYTGSAIQHMFLKQIFNDSILDETGLFFIHGLNPYGFKYMRKVTENNVDLNRNCLDEFPASKKNNGYAELQPLLMPQKQLNANSLNSKVFPLKVIAKIISKGLPKIRESTLIGQYQFSNGFYYGGKDWEPQIKQLKILIEGIMPEYETILNIDLHTGYGERGQMHVFLNPIDNLEVKSSIEYLFSHETIDWGNSKDFYTTNGDYLSWSNQLCNNSLCIPILLEFGTYNSQHIIGSINSLQIMIDENQGYHHGYKNYSTEVKTINNFKELYYPSSDEWKTNVINKAYQSLTIMMQNFNKFERKNNKNL